MSFVRQFHTRSTLLTMASKIIPATNKKLVVNQLSQNFRKATSIEIGAVPQPGPGQLLIKNKFAGINASDINVTAGRYDPAYAPRDTPFDCGFEGIGEVIQTGANSRYSSGQPVAYVAFGAFSEYTVIPEKFAMPVPSAKAEYIPLLVSGLTASLCMKKVADLKPGEVVLITAAAGGTGQFAVQLAKHKGCHVIGTCSSDEKVEFLKSLGCDRAINYRKEDLKEVLRKEYKKGIDVVYETIGGDVFDTCLTSLAIGGRLIVIGFIEGYENDMGFVKSKKAAMVQAYVLQKSASVRGFLLNHFTPLWGSELQNLVKMVDSGELKSSIDNGKFSAAGPFVGVEKVADAVDYLYSRKSVGKIVVQFQDQQASKL